MTRGEATWIAAVLLLAGAFYLWTVTSSGGPLNLQLQNGDLYNRLSDGFLAGQTSFRELPDPAFAGLKDPWDPAQNGPLRKYHDVSYFEGRYYLYFGATPAVVLLVPWRVLTGTLLPQHLAVVVFAFAGLAAGIALVVHLRRRYFPDVPAWVCGLCLFALAFGNFIPVLLRRPVYYELAIASAHAFGLFAMLCVARALEPSGRRRLWLALAGGAYGLAIGARPSYLFGAVLLAAPFLAAWRARTSNREFLAGHRAELLSLAAPLGAVVLALLAYNQARFGSPFEFGTSYMFAGLHPQKDAFSSFRFVPVNLWFYLLAPAQFSAWFPFVQVIHMPWFAQPAGYTGQENMYGLLPNLPFFWMLVVAWRTLRNKETAPSPLRDFALGVAFLTAANAFLLLRLGGAASRYIVDLLPPLTPLACVGVFLAERAIAASRRAVRVGVRAFWLAALSWTILFNVFVSLQHNELLRFHNPTTYRRLAHGFNRVPTWLGQTEPDKIGPLRIRLTFPRGKAGRQEPLIVTGLSFRADFLYVFYTDDRHIQFGFEHTSYGGPMTRPPAAIDYGAEHTVEVEMGSLYPPVEHPFYDGMPPEKTTALKRTLRVVLDGREVLRGTLDFYDSSPGDVSVGHNPVQDAFGRKFTGSIISVERLPVP